MHKISPITLQKLFSVLKFESKLSPGLHETSQLSDVVMFVAFIEPEVS